jgi:hypothetical protein
MILNNLVASLGPFGPFLPIASSAGLLTCSFRLRIADVKPQSKIECRLQQEDFKKEIGIENPIGFAIANQLLTRQQHSLGAEPTEPPSLSCPSSFIF